MKKTDSVILILAGCGIAVPLILGLMVLVYGGEGVPLATEAVRAVYNLFGAFFGLWMLLIMYIGTKLLLSGSFRETALAKITFLKKADEREEQLTGKAATSTFLVTIAILFFLLCLSCFKVSAYRVSPEQAVNGKTGNISLGLGFNLLKDEPVQADSIIKKDIFTYSGLPVSSSAVILLLLLLQVGTYNYYMRRVK